MFPFRVGEEITAEKNRTKKKKHVFSFQKLLLSSQVWLQALAMLSLVELTIKQRSALFSQIKSKIFPSIIIIYTPMVCGSIVNQSCLQKLNLNRFHPVTVRSRQTKPSVLTFTSRASSAFLLANSVDCVLYSSTLDLFTRV